MTEKSYEKTFWEIISALDKSGALPHVMIVGSWAEFLYSKSLGDNVRPGFRTRDMDILVPNIYRPNKSLPLVDELENIGFSYTVDTVSGVSKFFQPDGFELDFLARSLGRGSTTVKIPSTGIVAQSLRSVDILVNNPVVLIVNGCTITVPDLSAYILQKLLINSSRAEEKRRKDIDSLEHLIRNLGSYGYDLSDIGKTFRTLSSKKQKAILRNSTNLSCDLSNFLKDILQSES